jgi:L-lactate dehydrogenase (cytochrome)
MSKNHMDDYPAISYLEAKAKKRMPHFAWEYLASGTGAGELVDRNNKALGAVTLVPQLFKGRL